VSEVETVRLAAVQPAVRLGEIEANLAQIEDLIRDAHREHSPDVITVPESMTTPNVYSRLMHEAARTVDGQPFQLLARLARELGCVIGGGFIAARGGHTYGTYVLAEPDGSANLHDKDIPTAWEHNYYRGGDDDGALGQREIDGRLTEPLELAVVDIPADCLGVVSEKLNMRSGRMTKMVNNGSGRVRMEFEVPTRGLIGFRGQFLTDTRGTGILNTVLIGHTPANGREFDRRANGALVADRPGRVTSYALFNLQQRGRIYVKPGDEVYEGLIVGENARDKNLGVNITKEKHLTNHRAANADEIARLVPPRQFTLEQAMEYISDEELVEVTPDSLRLRKKRLTGWGRMLGGK